MFELLGRFHVVVVHFPIALLIVGGALELLGLRWPDPGRTSTARLCIALGAASAVVAAVLGWVHADCVDSGSSTADTLALHRWFGVATALFACAAVMFGDAARVSANARAMRLLSVALAAALVGVTGHLGGTLVYGEGFFSSAFDDDAPAQSSAQPSGASEFAARIRPILEARCYECHGERKQKGKLRLDRLDQAFEPGEDGVVIQRGDPAQSLLFQRVTLPADDEDHMPPKKSGPPLTQEQIELLRRWIEAGAPVS